MRGYANRNQARVHSVAWCCPKDKRVGNRQRLLDTPCLEIGETIGSRKDLGRGPQ